MKLYIAGPMQGYKNFNYDAFNEAADVLHSMGFEVVNPAENFDGRQDLPYERYIEMAIAQVQTVDRIIKLRGWRESKGVKEELRAAFDRGIDHETYESFTGLPSPQNEPDPGAVLLSEDDRLYKAEVEKHMFGPHGFSELMSQSTPNGSQTGRITDEAWDLVVQGDRQSSYGHPEQDFRTTGRQWGALMENWLRSTGQDIVMPDIPPNIVALMMAALKASRESQKPKRDNRVDGIGYWLCADRIAEGY